MSDPVLSRLLARELYQAREAVRAEMQAAAERGQLRTNGQMPSWPRYEKAQAAWDANVEAFFAEVGPPSPIQETPQP
jgi:hypothetical protein